MQNNIGINFLTCIANVEDVKLSTANLSIFNSMHSYGTASQANILDSPLFIDRDTRVKPRYRYEYYTMNMI